MSAQAATVRRRWSAAVAALACVGLALVAPGYAGASAGSAVVDPGIVAAARDSVRVVVQAVDGAVDEARRAVVAAGGAVEVDLPIVNGFAARVPGGAVADLEDEGSIWALTANRTGQLAALEYEPAATGSTYVRTSGAGAAWNQGQYGQGVGVAVIDTGVSAMPDFAGRLVHGPDLSGEGTYIDTHGHGTVMAGVIGGSGADSAGRSGGALHGVAPKATLVSVKVAGRNGAADVSTVLQAMHWVAAYKEQFNIRVLSLSWGVPSTQDPAVDPVDYAVQRLWRQGIAVIVAAGNSGPQSGTVLKPADDPTVITVGALDDKQNLDPADDSIPSWSSRGPTAQGVAKPDLVAPGRFVTAQRSYGSQIEADNPKALVAPSYIRGSGTSQATAVASGAAALLIGSRPELTPDQVKALLTGTAVPLSGPERTAQGAGRLNLAAALTQDAGPAFWQTPQGTGLGSIEASRGGRHVEAQCNGTTRVIEGEIDVRCEPWNGSQWSGSQWSGSQWSGSQWSGSQWSGSQWSGSQWSGGQWTGGSWQSAPWTGSQWSGSQWSGSQWSGSQWSGSQWSGSQWSGSQWSAAGYDEDVWLSTTWGTAFYGLRPPWWLKVVGETSEPVPTFCVTGTC